MNLIIKNNNIDEFIIIKQEVAAIKAVLNCLALSLATLFII